MKVDFENYDIENKLFLNKILIYISDVVKLRTEYEYQDYINLFEQDFAIYNKSKYVIAVNSGTTALQLSLRVCGVEAGDEVIVPAYTYMATALAVSNIAAVPVFVDIKEDTLTINPSEIEKKITKKTKAMIAVHIHGNPCDMDEILKIAKKYSLTLIEDASHAHGAEYKGIKVGNFGVGCFSCHSSKNLSGMGNSGLITINDIKIYKSIKEIIRVGSGQQVAISERTPCGIDILQTAILKTKLPYLNRLNEKRRSNAFLYIKELLKITRFQTVEPDGTHVYRDFVILTKNREKLLKYLKKEGIEAKVRYQIPLHLTEYYKKLRHKKGDLPITETVSNKILCLPVSYAFTHSQIKYVCETIKKYHNDPK